MLKPTNAGQADRVQFTRNRGTICLLSILDAFTRPWPDEIKMDPEVKKKVDAMWESLGLGAGG